jgi:ketosteroid isomerase-like protein
MGQLRTLRRRWDFARYTQGPVRADGDGGMSGQIEDRAQTLADARARKYTSADVEDLKVMVFGDTAIATGKYRGKGTDSGQSFAEYARWTDTWVKMPDGKWQCVASQYTSIQGQ